MSVKLAETIFHAPIIRGINDPFRTVGCRLETRGSLRAPCERDPRWLRGGPDLFYGHFEGGIFECE